MHQAFTPMEQTVMACLAEPGSRPRDLPAKLDRTWTTVSGHLTNIYEKLGVDNWRAAVDRYRSNVSKLALAEDLIQEVLEDGGRKAQRDLWLCLDAIERARQILKAL